MMNKNSTLYMSIRIILSMFLSAIIFCGMFAVPVYADESDDDYIPDGDRIIVSLGDSYSAGEGIEKFYGQDKSFEEKIEDHDWLGHRSEKSWPGQLKLKGVDGEMKDHRDSHWFFVASTGATTHDVFNRQSVKIVKKNSLVGRIFNSKKEKYETYNKSQDPQIDVFNRDELKDKTVDYVTMTMGGNDVGFAKIVTDTVMNDYFSFPQGLMDQLYDTWCRFYGINDYNGKTSIRSKLIEVYKGIDEKTNGNARIIIAGYPKLFSSNGSLVKTINDTEAGIINSNVHYFNLAIQNAVTDCKVDGTKIYFTSVEDVFEGHAAYDSDSYMNGIEVLHRSEDFDMSQTGSQYSVHPNEKGAKAYASRVNEVISYLDSKRGPRRVDTRFTQIENPGERDIVLVLDTSGSMSGEPLENTKKAAQEFVESVSNNEANIGIVKYSSVADIVCNFTTDKKVLKESINDMGANGSTNIDDGLMTAERMLNSKSSSANKKIIVLMSDGNANEGRTGNELYNYADALKSNNDIYIYTLGFFSKLDSNEKGVCQYTMERIASSGCHYEVTDVNSLVFFFGDIADQINGQKYIYVRIACPVDVTVFHNGETLSSTNESYNDRTSFGTLTFEESDTQNSSYSDYYNNSRYSSNFDSESDRVKILRLKEGENYDIRINGTGEGSMNYKIGFMDEKGEYNDFREFENVSINSKTQIDTMASISNTTVMNVDNNGDGKYDLTYEASENSVAKLSDRNVNGSPIFLIFIIMLAVAVLFAGIIVFIKIKRERKNQNPAN